jgi:hypothetical protein
MDEDARGQKPPGSRQGRGKPGRYQLTIPIDASAIEDRQAGDVKVAARDSNGRIQARLAKVDAKGYGSATLEFEQQPGALSVFVGPGDATDDELVNLETLQFKVSARRWGNESSLALKPLLIPPYYWYWWRRWCRTFVIRGTVVCPDGSPVVGAEVCAYDVDWFFIWSSKQLIGCATTDVNGAFELRFRWCCGWWPWWWWRFRVWQLDPTLSAHIANLARRHPELSLGPITGNQPNTLPFKSLAGTLRTGAVEPLLRTDVGSLERLREQLVAKLPPAPELERLHVWPWWPWWPWRDCTPDVIFRVTQDCGTYAATIVDEGIGDTRWNIPNPLDVTLVANDQACCRPPCPDPCEEGECIIIDRVCEWSVEDIGGNLGAPPAPAGYLHPGPVPLDTTGRHRPFGGIVPVYKNPGDLIGVDYLEFEFSADNGATWLPLPAGAGVNFTRLRWDDPGSPPSVQEPFAFDSSSFPGHTVLETREHREGVIGGTWDVPGADHFWLSMNWDLLIPIDSTKFADGTYLFRAIGWDDGGGGTLVNRRELPVCGEEPEINQLALTFDNRVITAVGHDASHLCGGIHICTVEPDTHILAVRVNGTAVGPCDTVDTTTGDLEIDFLARDIPAPGTPGHLDSYVLESRWGLNQSRNLLSQPGASVTVLSGVASGWALGQSSGNYGTALSQGAAAPNWEGGTFRLSMPLEQAFPEPCCYQLYLVAHKRTVVGGQSGLAFVCSGNHWNHTQLSLGIGVCPQR